MNEPTELSSQITLLKGSHTTAEIAVGADVSRETFSKIRRGQSVKLSTLLSIAKFLKATPAQTNLLVVAWVKLELGDEVAKHLCIKPASTAELKDAPDEIESLLKQLSPFDRQQIIKAMIRPEVRNAIPALNLLHDNLKGIQSPKPVKPVSYRSKR